MSNLANVVQQLRKERDQPQKRIGQLDGALKALGSLSGLRGGVGTRGAFRAFVEDYEAVVLRGTPHD